MPPKPDRPTDPYRTLGLEPGASMAEVKRAYRRLAKAFHPDSAGEAALPRFLAIHEAYEHIRTGKELPGIGRTWAATPAGAAAANRGEPREPWRADPARAQAARERARRPRASGGPAGAPGAATASSGAAAGGGTARGSGTGTTAGSGSRRGGSGAATGAPRAGSAGPGGSGRRRYVRKATLGSTSYDEARERSEASWSGASWYGPSTGEYWIINPREYADPRKHGPAYQARARDRAAAAAAAEATREAASEPATEREAAENPAEAPGVPVGEAIGKSGPEARVREAATRGWPRTGADGARASATPGVARTPWRETSPDIEERLASGARTWLGDQADDPIRRLGRALVAWPPLGIAAAIAIGEATGCAHYSASCTGAAPVLPWLAQAVLLGLLLLLPTLARVLATATVAVLLALVPVTASLIALGAQGHPAAGPVLATLLGVAWLAGAAFAIATDARRGTRRASP